MGRLIPAGTGMEYYRNVRLSEEMEHAAAKVQEEVTAAYEEAERAAETSSCTLAAACSISSESRTLR